MVGYSEVLQTMAAMVIFALILLSANRMIHRNTVMQVEGELEQEIVALAQDIIEEARTKEFDELSQGKVPPTKIPQDFTSASNLGPDDETADPEPNTNDDINTDGTFKRIEFDDFDDYNGWKDVLQTEHGKFNIETQVYYVNPNTYDSTGSGPTTFKKIKIYITSEFLKKNNSDKLTKYYLEFIRNYYAD